MMAAACIFQEDEDQDQFFDSREEVSSLADSCPDEDFVNWVSRDPWCKIWNQNPDSVQERREKFLTGLGWDLACISHSHDHDSGGEIGIGGERSHIDRLMWDGGAQVPISDSENVLTMPSSSSHGLSSSREGSSDESSEDSSISLREFDKDQKATVDEFKRSFGPSWFVQKLMRREDSSAARNSDKSVRRRIRWLRRLGAMGCIVDRQGKEINSSLSNSDLSGITKNQRVKVRSYRKKSKEFSAVFVEQDLKAHGGAILTMKFSPDGQYLASGGEDGVVRVWRVVVHERTDEDDLPEEDPSCIYFKVNHKSELAPLYADKEKKVRSSTRRSSDSACVVIPSEIFRIDEKPVHEFQGHQGDVLDLSWSKDKHLLSSSVDQTARLWRVGCDSCLGVFSHSNYVTCLQFNPANENYFVSGSIDGKVRLWEIPRCRVVDWIDVIDIVTAVCYRPDGKAGVVGTISGDCRYYNASDNHLQLDALIPLQGKKKTIYKRITGFEFSPSDPRRLMATSADSQLQILDGVDLVSKFKGSRSQISASFTSDGSRIVSASEDSNVYVWSHNNHDLATPNRVKSTWSCERFFSREASVAIPWNGFELRDQSRIPKGDLHHHADSLYLSSSGSFTLSQDLFSEFVPKGSATWPEEKLPLSSAAGSALCKSQYTFLKASCEKASSAWGQVIVTAGRDGRIRSFRNYGLPVHG